MILSIKVLNIDLTDVYEQFINSFPEKLTNPLGLANTRARIRMSTLYMISGNSNGIVVGTGNKVEDFGVGFFTKYGDGGVDISPIADLMKSEVYDLGKKLNIIDSIIPIENDRTFISIEENLDEDELILDGNKFKGNEDIVKDPIFLKIKNLKDSLN